MKIGFSATFNLPNSIQPFEKHWIEEDELLHGLNLFDITDEQIEQVMKNVRRIQYAIRKQVKDFAYESNKAAEKELMQSAINHSRNFIDPDYAAPQQISPEQAMIDLINKCTTIPKPTGLEQYQVLAKKYPSIQEAYQLKLEQLRQVEIQRQQQ